MNAYLYAVRSKRVNQARYYDLLTGELFIMQPLKLSYVTVSEKSEHSVQNMNFQLTVPADSVKLAL